MVGDYIFSCPFCGNGDLNIRHDGPDSFVRCLNCHATGPTGNPDEVVRKWDTTVGRRNLVFSG